MIVVTAPTGQIGHQLVAELIERHAPLRLVLRDPAKLPETVRDRVEVVEGSHGDHALVDRALAGADAVFWLAPPTPTQTLEETYLDFTRPAAEAIRRHGVKRVVSITSLGRGTEWESKAGLVTASLRMDAMLSWPAHPTARRRRPSVAGATTRSVRPCSAEGRRL